MKITVRLCLVSIIFLILFLSVTAEKKIDITPIKLPYDSLVLTDIYSYNSTILVRSENTIYKSIDDGKNWEISFESDKKINQLYSHDAHTIFIVGDSGLAYRTFDYGESWIDISYEIDYDFQAISAKDYSNYLIISKNRLLINDTKSLNGNLIPFEFISDIPLYSIIFSNDKYYFNGLRKKKEYYNYYGMRSVDIELPYFIFNGGNLSRHISFYVNGVPPDYYSATTDSLKLFPSKYGIYHSAVNNKLETTGININKGVHGMFYYSDNIVAINNDNIVNVFEDSDDTNIFTREGLWITSKTDSLINPGYKSYYKLEHQDLNIKPINSAFSTDSTSYIIASNNSMIYKAEFSDIISEVKTINQVSYELIGNKVIFNSEISLLSIYNYMGTEVNYELVSDFIYRLPKGLNFISYVYADEIKTIKVVVLE